MKESWSLDSDARKDFAKKTRSTFAFHVSARQPRIARNIRNKSLVVFRSTRLRVKLAWNSPIQSRTSISLDTTDKLPPHGVCEVAQSKQRTNSARNTLGLGMVPLTRISGLADGQTAWKESCRNGWSVSTSNAWPSRWRQQTRQNVQIAVMDQGQHGDQAQGRS